MDEIALASVERIMRNAGAERVSMDAIVAMSDVLEDMHGYLKRICETSQTHEAKDGEERGCQISSKKNYYLIILSIS